uniref:DEK_C domain-containing protein n=1 Tax=Caenorhabditis tropicalis TaxID=1561998 RepID=A0A1I7TSJ1_9PELO
MSGCLSKKGGGDGSEKRKRESDETTKKEGEGPSDKPVKKRSRDEEEDVEEGVKKEEEKQEKVETVENKEDEEEKKDGEERKDDEEETKRDQEEEASFPRFMIPRPTLEGITEADFDLKYIPDKLDGIELTLETQKMIKTAFDHFEIPNKILRRTITAYLIYIMKGKKDVTDITYDEIMDFLRKDWPLRKEFRELRRKDDDDNAPGPSGSGPSGSQIAS